MKRERGSSPGILVVKPSPNGQARDNAGAEASQEVTGDPAKGVGPSLVRLEERAGAPASPHEPRAEIGLESDLEAWRQGPEKATPRDTDLWVDACADETTHGSGLILRERDPGAREAKLDSGGQTEMKVWNTRARNTELMGSEPAHEIEVGPDRGPTRWKKLEGVFQEGRIVGRASGDGRQHQGRNRQPACCSLHAPLAVSLVPFRQAARVHELSRQDKESARVRASVGRHAAGKGTGAAGFRWWDAPGVAPPARRIPGRNSRR